MNNKNIKVTMGLTSLIFLLVCFCQSCNNPHNKDIKSVKTEDQKLQEQKEYERVVCREYVQVFGLLAAKYDVGIDTVESISIEYLRIFEPYDYLMIKLKSPDRDTTATDYFMKPKQSVPTTISLLSAKYNIAKSKIAAIIYDFRLYFIKKESD